MIVLAGYTSVDLATITQGNLAKVNLPAWIINKIYVLRTEQNYVLPTKAAVVSRTGTISSFDAYLIKVDNEIFIWTNEVRLTDYVGFRMQFDLVISMS